MLYALTPKVARSNWNVNRRHLISEIKHQLKKHLVRFWACVLFTRSEKKAWCVTFHVPLKKDPNICTVLRLVEAYLRKKRSYAIQLI